MLFETPTFDSQECFKFRSARRDPPLSEKLTTPKCVHFSAKIIIFAPEIHPRILPEVAAVRLARPLAEHSAERENGSGRETLRPFPRCGEQKSVLSANSLRKSVGVKMYPEPESGVRFILCPHLGAKDRIWRKETKN